MKKIYRTYSFAHNTLDELIEEHNEYYKSAPVSYYVVYLLNNKKNISNKLFIQ